MAVTTSTAFTKWFWMMVLALGGGASAPLGVPPLPEDPVLARIAPEECLAYFASAGTATADPKSPNQTEQLLAEPEVQSLAAEVERLLRSGLVQGAKLQGAEEQALAQDGITLLKALLVRPMAVYVSQVKLDRSGPDIRAGIVVNLGDDVGRFKAPLLRYWSMIQRDRQTEAVVEGDTFSFNLGGKEARATWSIKGQHLFVAIGQGEWESLLKRANAAGPQWLTTLRQKLPIERTSTVGMLNVKSLVSVLRPLVGPQLDPVLETTGLSGVSQVAVVSGLDQTGFVSRIRVTLSGEPRGLLQLAVQQPLTSTDLAAIPRDATFAVAAKCDPDKFDVNAGLLPSAHAIRSHLRPGVTTVRRVSAGIEITSRQTLPTGSLASVVPLAVTSTLAARWTQSQRAQAGALQDMFAAREAAQRTQSMNNLKQIALAMHNYHDVHKTFPPAYRAENSGTGISLPRGFG